MVDCGKSGKAQFDAFKASPYPAGERLYEQDKSFSLTSNDINGRSRKQSRSKSEGEVQQTAGEKPRDQSKNKRIEKKAFQLFQSSKGLSMEECTKKATEELRKNTRMYSQKHREKLKEQGMKRKRYHREGYNTKDEIIGRYIVKLLGEKNGIVRHDDARKLAEQLYSQGTRERSAKHRRKKRLLKANKNDGKEEEAGKK
ncbi:uncharacterized protein FA14DRAFT_153813 [Meira miltonrushii]|uniref:Uncharacterized protein n=1 Tax=Meira miltonrushii TaxID=1280837 RepID=A0A316VLM4_9BASI|nr:uncharacterized protein FA14DRAFT_153813 [Meira miltonrushii]PWN38492.1 hypothetical protein FA14DRAFT_153813 [Meira miltonrushii]